MDKLILISNILTLVPLPFLLFINNSYFQPEFQKKENDINSESSNKEHFENEETQKLKSDKEDNMYENEKEVQIKNFTFPLDNNITVK